MNSYYSNRIEGQATHPTNIERALQQDFSGRPEVARRQRVALAHIEAERDLEQAVTSEAAALSSNFLCLPKLKERLGAYVLVKGATEGISEYRRESILPLQTVAVAGAVSRGEFIRMMGLGERTGRKVISRFLSDGLLKSDSHRSNLGVGFPMSSLNILFPNLYPEAATTAVE